MDNDEKYYDIVAQEIRNNRINDALWAKAIAESMGDENKTKAVYIQLRVKQLIRAEMKSQQDAELAQEQGQEPEDWHDEEEEYDAGVPIWKLQIQEVLGSVYFQGAVFIIGVFAIYQWLWPWARSLRGTFN